MELWDCYKRSIFLCHQRLAEHVNFAIISAQNPAGLVTSNVSNQLLDKKLQAHLLQIGVPYRSVIGAAPDLSVQEKSWMVLCDKTQAVATARLFAQNAIYWIEQNQLFLVPVLLNLPEENLGLFHSRMVLLPS